jgi:hypothetical protein
MLRKTFCYVEGYSTAFKQWKRMKVDELQEKLVKPSSNYRVFASVQRYEKPRSEAGEKVWMPLFFDLDAEDPARALEDAKKVAFYFFSVLGIHESNVRIFFSGKKGFHIIVNPEVFDIRPEKDLHLKIRKACMQIAEGLGIADAKAGGTFDHTVYSARRVLRIPNSIHEATKLYKVELSFQELSLGMDVIRKVAEQPKKLLWPLEPEEEVSSNEDAQAFWKSIEEDYAEAHELANLKPDIKIHDFGDLPVCMKHVLALNALPRPRTGNRTMLAIGSYLKDAGTSEDEAVRIMQEWALRQKNIGWADEPEKLKGAVASTVKYIYRPAEAGKESSYQFSCKYMLALGTADHKIPCQGVQCPAIRGKMQVTKETINLELADFSKSIYLAEKVRVPTLVSGKAGTPYVVPKRVRFTCHAGDKQEFCAGCPIAAFNGEASFEFDVRDPEILEIVGCSNRDQWVAIRKKFHFPHGCMKSKARVEEYMNVEEIRMSPAAVDPLNFVKSEFVARRGFFVGYPMQSNKRFYVTGFPVKDPKNQTSAIIFQECEKLETEVETFKMTPEIMRELTVFKLCGDQDVEDKLREIHTDLAANIYRIWDRQLLAYAFDIVAHSVRGFKFRAEPFVKGWCEMLVVGDSGQGKSAIARRLIAEHYRVGEMISGGGASRTGLLYSYQEQGRGWMLIWGALPLNDLGMVVIDEFGDLDPDQFGKLTDVRSSGICKADGIIRAETFARVRLVALTNPKAGKHLSEYTYPVMAIKDLIKGAEDIRRFDFAMSVASGEVAVEKINQADEEKVPHVYTAGLCRNLIRWAWSRGEAQIEFTDDASRMVLAETIRMAGDFYAGEIPLVEPADHRFKIARLAAAIAARVFSSSDDGERLIIESRHVGFATAFLYEIYKSKNFKYDEWSASQLKQAPAKSMDMERAFSEFMTLLRWKTVLGMLRSYESFDEKNFRAFLGDDRLTQTTIVSLVGQGLITKKWRQFVKTPKGKQLVEYSRDKVPEKETLQAMQEGGIFS